MNDAGPWIVEHDPLPVAIDARRGVIRLNLVPVHRHGRQDVTFIRKAEIRRRLKEYGPRIYPQPELILLVRIEGEFVRLLAVALEEACQRLTRIHHLQEACVVDQFLGAVR